MRALILLAFSALCGAAEPPRDSACPSRGVLTPESADALFATARRCARDEIDLREFQYQGCSARFDFEQAWMTTRRARQADGSDTWKDLSCSTNFEHTHGWSCRVEKQRTVSIDVEHAGREFDFRIPDDMGGGLAQRIISPVIAELFRVKALAVCESGQPVEVDHEAIRSHRLGRAQDGWLERKVNEYRLVVGQYALHIGYDAAHGSQPVLRCWELPDVLE